MAQRPGTSGDPRDLLFSVVLSRAALRTCRNNSSYQEEARTKTTRSTSEGPSNAARQRSALMSDDGLNDVFSDSIRRFSNALSTLRQYTQTTEAHLQKEHTKLFKENSVALLPSIILDINRSATQASPPLTEDVLKEVKNAIDRAKEAIAPLIVVDERSSSITVARNAPQVEKAIARAMESLSTNRQKLTMFREATVVMSVSSVEVLLTEIVRFHYRSHPSALDEAAHHFTYAELCNFGDISDAKAFLLEKKIADTMYGSMDSWIDFIKSLYNVRASYLDEMSLKLKEVGARRNLIVHNQGRANARYVAIATELGNKVEVGQRIPLSRGYLFAMLDTLEISFVLLAAEAWSRVCAKDEKEKIADLIGFISYRALTEDRFDACMSLSKFVEADKDISEDARLTARFNYWLSFKLSNRFKSVAAQVQKLDVDTLNFKFQLAWLALLDKADEFFAVLNDALKVGQIDAAAARDWPIFREMRRDSRFEKALKSFGVPDYSSERISNADLMRLLALERQVEKAAPAVDSAPATIVTAAARPAVQATRRRTLAKKARGSRQLKRQKR